MLRSLHILLILGILCVCTCTIDDCSKPNWFECKNGNCVQHSFVCDGEDDCDDNSDETDCTEFTFAPSITCADDEFQCLDTICIPNDWACNGKQDCLDGSDETIGCIVKKKCEGFVCQNGLCISNRWVCDGVNDCKDNSDERNCSNYGNALTEACNNTIDSYLCKNKECITLDKVCDNKNDCQDNSDEDVEGCANAKKLCDQSNFGCSHFCRKTPNGPICSCRNGYNLMNNRTCLDIDECKVYGKCDQHCINLEGSFKCTCENGYRLQEDKQTCKAVGGEALMVFSSKTEIRGLYLDSKYKKYFPIIRDLQHVVGVSVDSEYVYWSNVETGDEAICRKSETLLKPEVIVTAGLGTPEEIAIDWVTSNVYFTDRLFKHIGVCNHNGSSCTVIISESVSKPRGIALLPSAGQMYWSDWSENPHISKAGMDGKGNTPFITENIHWPNGLAIDYPNERLYWVDAKLKIIESVDLNGNDRRTVLQDVVKHPYSIAIFENKLYWSDWNTKSIQSCNKFTGKSQELLKKSKETIYGIHIYHPVLKPKIKNPCAYDPCSHICLLAVNKTYSCACPLDKKLGSDQQTCKASAKQKYMIIGAGNMFISYYHEIIGRPAITATLTIKHITSLAYNFLSGTVFGSDRLTNSIFQYYPQTGKAVTLKNIKKGYVEGIDFDYLGNNLYWCDRHHKTIEIYSRNTNQTSTLQFTEVPSNIVLIPNYGIMYVVFHSESKVHIDKLQMTGLGSHTHVIESNIVGPKVTLAYDREFEQLFWADEGTGRIESTSVEGNDRYLFRTQLYGIVSLAILNRVVFWTIRDSNRVYWASKDNAFEGIKNIPIQVANELEIMHLVTLDGIYGGIEHECSKNNAGCSHVCLVVTSKLHMCSCPLGSTLDSDKRNCNKQTMCRSNEMKCTANNICIDKKLRCNGIENCLDGEDEANCTQITTCSSEEFTCKSGECINLSKRCNSFYNCKDQSDEEGCNNITCKPNEFQCRQGDCISKYLVCDNHNDCNDFSDEDDCNKRTCDTNSFSCNDGHCIPKHWVCDGEVDCMDRSDESEICKQNLICSAGTFTCFNRRCIDKLLVCNSIDDCGDNSDERDCLEETKIDFTGCKKDEYQCYGTYTCVPQSSRCNGIKDCPRHDDEYRCAECEQYEFTCKNLNCISQSWVCDNIDDCGDKSDEKNCSDGHQVIVDDPNSTYCEEFRCKMGTCLSYSSVCNGKPDCYDNSDEGGKCGISCKIIDPCEKICLKTPSGPVCSCPKGYRLRKDGHSCEDINECDDGVCFQICHNKPGSFSCSCFDGYTLRSNRVSCKVDGPPMVIITSMKGDIRKISPSLNSIEVVHRQSNIDVTGLDVNAARNIIYWSSEITETINKMFLETKVVKVITDIGRPRVLAVDWVTDNVYLYDIEHSPTIKVCNIDEEKCARLISLKETTNILAIAVDPIHGFMFWSETSWSILNNPTSEIYRTDMTGLNLTVVAFQRLGTVSGIAIDYMRSHLYWADTHFHVIEKSDFNGANRQIFLKELVHQPMGLNLYDDSLFWLMENTGKLKSCSLYNNTTCQTIETSSSQFDEFVLLQISRQPFVINYCQNHTCDYMCVLKNGESACICPDGYLIKPNNMCSNDINRKIILNSNSSEPKQTREKVALTGIIITAVTVVGIVSAYCYYRIKKHNMCTQPNLSAYFKNPTYNRSRELATIEPVEPVEPPEHEYSNPLINLPSTAKVEEKDTQVTIEQTHSDHSDSELEGASCSQRSSLIH